ncbi:ribonuclease P protein component [Actinoalloteichus sp. AHMU CJ021]|uniref:Ribonuclease P protein component n=1 Tax=Actinoalloteichus caeruleus DSM 43889 TaxID=1120930 RepID=A0ABT1JKE2_ACTCY|nr:ribonuclease P protein component [Actinoalloteichus caeruleus]AUS78796.1 ribonuclease P protein component [Actinoalloteichus sp. AHMU CJ021]MCP2332970.1 ribonuclease P protein component [Actinoalloteichus caeruleus DSM 43889]
MLPPAARLTKSQDFDLVVRRGRRAGRRRVVLHALCVPELGVGARDTDNAGSTTPTSHPTRVEPPRRSQRSSSVPGSASTRVGFVVSKAVGNAVVRHQVARRLRHVVRERLAAIPRGTSLVVRALPPSATASSRELAADVDRLLARLGLVDDPSASRRRTGGSPTAGQEPPATRHVAEDGGRTSGEDEA